MLSAAHELYRLLLAPVEAGWRPAKNLIVTTMSRIAVMSLIVQRCFGPLPLSLLPTAPDDGAR